MSDLKPCPFCGGRQTYRKHDGGVWLTTTNHKRGCIMRDALAFVAFNTEAEAIAAWNSRAEMGYEDTLILLDELGLSERTCHVNELDALTQTLSIANCCAWGECSACGSLTPEDSRYCVECGARVVGE